MPLVKGGAKGQGLLKVFNSEPTGHAKINFRCTAKKVFFTAPIEPDPSKNVFVGLEIAKPE